MKNKTKTFKITDNSSDDNYADNHKKNDSKDSIVSPTQIQMDEWVQSELAEAEDDSMLADEVGSVFPEASKSID